MPDNKIVPLEFDELDGVLMDNTILKERAFKALDNLGSTPQEVADNLYSLGVRGKEASGMACPIANYLNQNVPGGHKFSVGIDVFGVLGKSEWNLPQPIMEFVDAFDASCYPGLVEDQSDEEDENWFIVLGED